MKCSFDNREASYIIPDRINTLFCERCAREYSIVHGWGQLKKIKKNKKEEGRE